MSTASPGAPQPRAENRRSPVVDTGDDRQPRIQSELGRDEREKVPDGLPYWHVRRNLASVNREGRGDLPALPARGGCARQAEADPVPGGQQPARPGSGRGVGSKKPRHRRGKPEPGRAGADGLRCRPPIEPRDRWSDRLPCRVGDDERWALPDTADGRRPAPFGAQRHDPVDDGRPPRPWVLFGGTRLPGEHGVGASGQRQLLTVEREEADLDFGGPEVDAKDGARHQPPAGAGP